MVSLLIDQTVERSLNYLWFVLTLLLNSKNKFMMTKLAGYLGVLYNKQIESIACLKLFGCNTLKWSSSYNSVTATKYIPYINIIYSMLYSFHHVCWLSFIVTSIDTFLSKLAFLAEQRRRKANDG